MTFVLYAPEQAREAFRRAWERTKASTMDGHRMVLELGPETRSSPQNRRLWALLRDVSQQVVWHGQKLSDEEWKHIFTASLKRQKVVPGIDGEFVVLGQSTSRMSKAEMAELQDLIEAFGAQHEVRFSAPEYSEEQI